MAIQLPLWKLGYMPPNQKQQHERCKSCPILSLISMGISLGLWSCGSLCKSWVMWYRLYLPCARFLTIIFCSQGNVNHGIVHQYPFTSHLQRMTVIVQRVGESKLNIYTKGAPETIVSLCRPETGTFILKVRDGVSMRMFSRCLVQDQH